MAYLLITLLAVATLNVSFGVEEGNLKRSYELLHKIQDELSEIKKAYDEKETELDEKNPESHEKEPLELAFEKNEKIKPDRELFIRI